MAFLYKVELCGVDTSKLPILKNEKMTGAVSPIPGWRPTSPRGADLLQSAPGIKCSTAVF